MKLLTAMQALLFLLLIGYAGGYEIGSLNDSGMLIRVVWIFGGMALIHIIKNLLKRCEK